MPCPAAPSLFIRLVEEAGAIVLATVLFHKQSLEVISLCSSMLRAHSMLNTAHGVSFAMNVGAR